jgi:hypothetical protein
MVLSVITVRFLFYSITANDIFVLIYSNIKTDLHDITEILLKLALNTLTLTPIVSNEMFNNLQSPETT